MANVATVVSVIGRSGRGGLVAQGVDLAAPGALYAQPPLVSEAFFKNCALVSPRPRATILCQVSRRLTFCNSLRGIPLTSFGT